ncbi:MAG: NusG domain II-containing protein [Spirochaetales bacterium]|nr:NusG domain II-containing protein [Spirochaetales bacterium]
MNFFLKKVRAADFVILIFLLVLSIFLVKKSFLKKYGKVKVNANGTEYEYSLSQDGIYKVEGALGITVIEIKNKKVRILDSACPNKTCVNQDFANPIVCLPNKVIIQLEIESENSSPGDFDVVSQ